MGNVGRASSSQEFSKTQTKSLSVILRGGVGNQLFALAAALEQAKRLGVGVKILSSSATQDLRPIHLWLNRDDTGLVGFNSVRQKLHKVLFRTNFLRHLYYDEKGFAFDPDINLLSPGAVLRGYFQSPRYFPSIEHELLSNILLTPEEPLRYRSRRVAIHVRRGDYTQAAATKKHGLAGKEYFVKALSEVLQPFSDEDCEVFTDSPALLPDVLRGLPQSPMNGRLDFEAAMQSLRAMAHADVLIASNSTLSWWAARAARLRNEKCEVFVPSPWFADGTSADDLLPSDWVRIPIR